MCAHTHPRSVVVPDHLLQITGKEIVCKGHPGTIKERGRGKECSLISSSLNSNNLWQNCAYETAEHLGILICLNREFKNLLGSCIAASELSKKGKVKILSIYKKCQVANKGEALSKRNMNI